MTQLTLGIVKPNATANNHIGDIVAMAEKGGLRVRAMRMTRLSKEHAEAFYAVHQGKKFFDDLVEFMCSGPVVALALEGEDAVPRWRNIMGATNPAEAEEGTIRKLYAEDIQNNAVHGSDSPENAAIEVAFFFNTTNLVDSQG